MKVYEIGATKIIFGIFAAVLSLCDSFNIMSSNCTVIGQVSLPSSSGTINLGHVWASNVASWGRYPQHVRLSLAVNNGGRRNQVFVLDLEQNRDLLTTGFNVGSEHNRTTIENRRNNFCYYHGTVLNEKDSYAAVNLCGAYVNGVIWSRGEHWVLESNLTNGNLLSLYPASQANQPVQNCDGLWYSAGAENQILRRRKRELRSTPEYYSLYVDRSTTRYVELALVADYELYQKYDSNLEFVQDRMIQIGNLINSLYYPLNIRIALVHVEVWTAGDQITITSDPDYTLKNFLYYREKRLLNTVKHDNAQLLSDTVFGDGVVGKAHKGSMCSYLRSGGVNIDHSRRVIKVASTVAHEMGHNFGMEHDNDTCDCPDERCVMAPSSGGLAPSHWSSCSLEYLAYGLKHGTDHCLRNKPDNIFQGPLCGNGFTEPGEECDCGTAEVCTNPCCDPNTCRIKGKGECATGECCDTEVCKFKPATTTCRDSKNDCDFPEFCNGKTDTCPSDTFKQNGLKCNDNQGFCYGGRCGMRESQCKLLWGNTGVVADDECYSLNEKGTVHGNCGYNSTNKIYAKCSISDSTCGRLHCDHKNERTEYGDRSVVETAYTYITMGRSRHIACRVAQLHLQPDPGMVPDGSKCDAGIGKMCLNQRCVKAENVLRQKPCDPPNCHGYGICNNLGNCHCQVGYGGTDCGVPGPGGSIDSGPAPASNNTAVAVICAVLFFVLFGAVVGFFIYNKKKHGVWIQKKYLQYLVPRPRQTHYKPPPTMGSPTPAVLPNAVLNYPLPKVSNSNLNSNYITSTLPRQKASITALDISPPVPDTPMPAAAPNSNVLVPARRAPPPPAEFEKNTFAHTLPRLHKIETAQNPKLSESYTHEPSSRTLQRQPSLRPEKPPPPVPNVPTRPRDSVMESLYAERGSELLPKSYDPPVEGSLLHEVICELDPPADPLPAPKQPTPPPEDPIAPARRIHRNTSSASSNGKRPDVAPPPPPATAKPKWPVYDKVNEYDDDDDNYYEVIPIAEECGSKISKPKPLVPAKPAAGKVNALKAKFDPKSGTVSNTLIGKK